MPTSKKPRKKVNKSKRGESQKTPLNSVEDLAVGNLDLCLDFMDDFGLESSAFREFFTLNRKNLMSDDTVAFGLVYLSSQEGCSENAGFLFDRLLDEARMDIENDGPYGTDFVKNVEMAIEAGMAANAFSSYNMMIFSGAFQKAGLLVPDFFKKDILDMDVPETSEDFDPNMQLIDLEKNVLADGGTAYDLYNLISEVSAVLPNEVMAMLANLLAKLDGKLFERCALYFLLSEDADVRIAVASGIYERHEQSGLSVETLTFLPIIRGWLPNEPARDCIDDVNKKERRRNNADSGHGSKSTRIFEVSASVMDGVGAQSIAIAARCNGKFFAAMVLTKHGHGVKDAFLVPYDSKKEMLSTLSNVEEATGGASISRETLQILLQGALADGIDNGKIPAPGILDVLEVSGLQDLRPQTAETSKLLDFIDLEKTIQNATPQVLEQLINDDRALCLLEPLTDSWFEDTEETREVVAKGRTARSVETKIWEFLESRRDLWARKFLQTAMTLRESKRFNECETLTASAYGLMNGRSLKRIPLMTTIAHTTIDAARVQML